MRGTGKRVRRRPSCKVGGEAEQFAARSVPRAAAAASAPRSLLGGAAGEVPGFTSPPAFPGVMDGCLLPLQGAALRLPLAAPRLQFVSFPLPSCWGPGPGTWAQGQLTGPVILREGDHPCWFHPHLRRSCTQTSISSSGLPWSNLLQQTQWALLPQVPEARQVPGLTCVFFGWRMRWGGSSLR